MASYTCEQYFLARIPDFLDVLPSFPVAVAIQAAIALYWDRFIPSTSGLWVDNTAVPPVLVPPDIDETLLTERQKVIVGLRAMVASIPAITAFLTTPHVTEGAAGPAIAKFEELNKLLRVMLPVFNQELSALEAFEGIFFTIVPAIPAYLLALKGSYLDECGVGYIVEKNAYFITGGND